MNRIFMLLFLCLCLCSFCWAVVPLVVNEAIEEEWLFPDEDIIIWTPPIYYCPIHGKIDTYQVWNFAFEGEKERHSFCLKCLCEFLKDNIGTVEEINENETSFYYKEIKRR